ncbi:nucleolin [Selaginella moellendorffii]|uniref:nucleolin n=1 Tax=Selaginella moellendorffii TaxID=88036 RepID=UPI000D1C8D18|nr:nucleolin [Selaginella moellendorffii]XP_024527690.1 nucleolin [Selaginella moellendorffii]|eukprot:XP_002966835.2 nucleolin [Selaginella moellendorffii]
MIWSRSGGGGATLPAAMAKVASSVAATCFPVLKGRVWRINRLAARIYPPQVCRVSISRQQVIPAWSSLAFRGMVSTGAVAKKEKIFRVEEKDEEDELDDEEDEEENDDEEEEEEGDSLEARKNFADNDDDDPGELEIIKRISAEDTGTENKKPGPWKSRFPPLSQKEKKELRGHAHRLGKSIALHHVGKWGVTPNSLKCLGDALEKNELMKVRVLDNCPTHISQVMLDLEHGLEAQVVGKIGHVLLLYRPSLRKAEMDEKKQKVEMDRKKRPHSRQERGWKAHGC